MMMRRSTVRMALARSLGLVAVVAMSAAGATVLGQQPPASPQRQPLLDGKGFGLDPVRRSQQAGPQGSHCSRGRQIVSRSSITTTRVVISER
jgi:hypothetical protein